jgi:predicted ATP-binding protein involved in virulence
MQLERLHDQVLEELLDWQRAGNASDQLDNSMSNYRLFYLRRAQDTQFQRGYWFPGNDSYMLISFWAGSDTRNRTPNAFLRFHVTQGCSAFFTARDSEDKQQFFRSIQNTPQFTHYKAKKTAGYWQTSKLGALSDWKQVLIKYLSRDKPAIDYALNDYQGGVGAEFETKFWFLERIGFDRSLERVLAKRLEINEQYNPKRIIPLRESSLARSTSEEIGLLAFSINNYRGIRQADVTDLNPTSRWIFLTGENGYGKTSVLRALAQAFSRVSHLQESKTNPPVSESWHTEHTRITGRILPVIQVSYYDEKRPKSLVRTLGYSDSSAEKGLEGRIVAYGPLRLGVLDEQTQNHSVAAQDNVYSLFDPVNARLVSTNYELFRAKRNKKSNARFDLLRRLIKTVTNNRIVNITLDDITDDVHYHEANEEGKIVARSTLFEELATGYQSLVNLIVDLFLRLSAGQPNLEPEELTGLVLIDELENHLHPHMQRQLPISLHKIFPRVQFVVSTHSPIPLLGAPDNAIFLRVDRAPKDGITIQKVEVDISNLLPNSILSSPIFGFQELVPASHSSKEWVRTEDTYTGILNNDKLRAETGNLFTAEKQKQLLELLKKVQK